MRVLDFSPDLVHGVGALAGLTGGLVAGRIADVMPRRYGITHLATGRPRARRNLGLVALGGAIGLWLAHMLTLAAATSLERAIFYFAVNLVLCTGLVAAAAVDLEHMILPNELTLGGAALALATAPWRGIGVVGAIAGMVVGLAVTYLPALAYKRLRGRSGMGLGDAKLTLVAGAWLGAEGAIFVVFAAAVQSALSALLMRAFGLTFAVPASVVAELAELRAKADAGDEEARALLADDPMGPFLVLACLEFVFARRQILDLFDRLVAPQ
jgi:leader peptidase (prepilin peptidase) / N-methyltransferase